MKKPVRHNRNLLKIFDELNRVYFNGLICGGIGWRTFSSNKGLPALAVCDMDERFIRMNTVLQDSRVPVWYVKFVVYHEMLHLLLRDTPGGYGHAHNEQFRLQEEKYPDFERGMKFETTTLLKIRKQWQELRKEKK